jgi:hypothetical protein
MNDWVRRTTPAVAAGDRIVVEFEQTGYSSSSAQIGAGKTEGPGRRSSNAISGEIKNFMKIKQIVVVMGLLVLSLPLAAHAQVGMGPRMPVLSGIWRPVVGTGGAYEMTDRDGKKSQMEMTVVGKEDVNGKTGYWMEMAVARPGSSDQMYMKYLIAPTDNGMAPARMIMQPPGQGPMEMDLSMMNRGGRQTPQSTPSDIRDKAELVGTESVTVPAGTFSCEHYKMKDGSSDAWVSDKVAPWGLVKVQGKDSSMILTKVITDAKDHITGTPTKFDPMQMMRDRGGQQGQ